MTKTLRPIVGTVALRYVRETKLRIAEYLEEKRAWYESGDGRSTEQGGRGWTFPYCFHGYSLWTDYDNICPGCEDGYSPYLTEWIYRDALYRAKRDVETLETRLSWLNSAPHDLPQEMRSTLLSWVLEATN